MANGKKIEAKTPSIFNNFTNPEFKEADDVENGDEIDDDGEDGDANELFMKRALEIRQAQKKATEAERVKVHLK